MRIAVISGLAMAIQAAISYQPYIIGQTVFATSEMESDADLTEQNKPIGATTADGKMNLDCPCFAVV